MSVDFAAEIATELGLPEAGVVATLKLLAEEATVPFIARYRKEMTGGLDEVQIAQVRDGHDFLGKLAERKATILKTIAEQGKLTDELRAVIEQTRDATRLEDLYRPYKPKRKTRATVAIAKGLEPLADLIWAQAPVDGDPEQIAAKYIDEEKGVPDIEAAWHGARDIVAERISENANLRQELRELFLRQGTVEAQVKKGRQKQGAKFRDYFSFQEMASKIPSHRMLAIRRGESEGHLSYRVTAPWDQALEIVKRHILKGDGGTLVDHLRLAAEDGYDRLLAPSIEGNVRNRLRKRADTEATHVFATNLRMLFMAPPLGGQWVLGIDPGFRSGCKMVALDGKGDLLASTVISPLKGKGDTELAAATVQRYCQQYRAEAIAVGNGTAGRETEAFLRDLGRDLLNDAMIVLVNEAGASVYSASDLARDEFPNLDVTIRGAISIGRRLQDPLAELVKIEPKAIGVGQYQHDVDQDQLKHSLDDTVQSCVNAVGVDLNTASPQLLQYVSGLGASQSKQIVKHRAKSGRFTSRRQLLEVATIGPKTFEQAAGFLRIRGAENPLDASAVHPERYELVEQIAKDLDADIGMLITDEALRGRVDTQKYVTDEVGLPTLKDILAELAKPGRDPRDKFDPVQFAPGITDITHLEEGMILEGVVTNVADFGAFVDVGVHQDGLVHLSELAWNYIEDAGKVVAVGQKIKVKVVGVDLERKRISLSKKQTTEAPKQPERPARPERAERPPQEKRPPRDRRERDDRPRRPRDDRPPPRGRNERDDRVGGKPKYDSPFAVLQMKSGVLSMKDDDKKKKDKDKKK